MNKIVLGLAIAVVLALGFLVTSHFLLNNESTRNNEQERSSPPENQFVQDNSQSAPCESPLFTEYFVDPQQVQKVGQVGVVHGSGLYIVERSYVSIKNELSGQKIPVYAPVDMQLRAGSHYYNPATSATALPDYALWFDAGCQVEINFAHLKEVVESIALQLPDVKTDSRNTQLQPIQFKAGELIGYFIYNEGDVAGFDFIVRDKKVVNQFINQERYAGNRAGNLINGVCPYDYYEPTKKEAYYNLLGGGGGTRFTVKDCGKVSRDLSGTIAGMWFLDKEPQESIYESYKDGAYGSTLSIVGDEERVTIGNLGQQKVSWVYNTNPSYLLPETVTNEHCYQFDAFTPGETAGWAYFKILSDTELEVFFSQTGTCPTSFPSNAKRYYK